MSVNNAAALIATTTKLQKCDDVSTGAKAFCQ
jgi:hypothetical protein